VKLILLLDFVSIDAFSGHGRCAAVLRAIVDSILFR
jgi:hypothetical protein